MSHNAKQQKTAKPTAKSQLLALVGEDVQSLREDRDDWRKSVRIWQGVSGALLVLSFVLGSGAFKGTERYFMQVTDGKTSRLVELRAFEAPVAKVSDVTNFGSRAASEALSFSFVSWNSEIDRLHESFTPSAVAQLKSGLAKSAFFTRLEESRSITTVSPKAAPRIVAEQEIPGGHGWQLSFPVVVTWNGPKPKSEEVQINMVVRLVAPEMHPRGLMVEQINIG